MAKALEDRVIEQIARPVVDEMVFEPTQRRVRVMLGGVTIADSANKSRRTQLATRWRYAEMECPDVIRDCC